MANRSLYIILFFIAALISCGKDETQLVSSGATDKILRYEGCNFEDVYIETKSTLSEVAESRVRNMYLFVFDEDNAKIYADYFDANNLVNGTITDNTRASVWTQEENAPKGEIVMGASNCSNAEIWIIANINADMLNISPEKLNFITSKDELIDLTASLNQNVVTRTGMFPMVGSVNGIRINGNDITKDGNPVTVLLERLDAKVNVNIGVDKTEQEGDETDPTVIKQKIIEFRPESWSVMNLPQGTFVVDKGKDDYTDTGLGYFDFKDASFETYENEKHGFSFYMLENKHQPKQSVGGNYHLRDKRIKITDGTSKGEYWADEGDMWEYAKEYASYLVIKGEVVMDVDVTTNAKTQKLSAQVVYYIHLGDIGKDKDNYSVVRNTHYTYNITIKGVDNIEFEVTKDVAGWKETNEKESGATGMVYVAKEDIYTFDSHFGQRVFCFDQAYIVPETVTWYVKTPFGREGTPELLPDGTEVPYGLDYKWVHFMVNDINEETGAYDQKNQPYSPDDVTDVLAFIKYIKQQKLNYDKGLSNDFRAEYDDAWRVKYNKDNGENITEAEAEEDTTGPWYRYRIYVTVFVDEYYYDDHPINPIEGYKDPLLWQSFVNQPNRVMHILSDSHFSTDGASSTTGSVVTIRQHSIQTPFNYTDPTVSSGWGAETIDETRDYFWFYSKNEGANRPEVPDNMTGNTSTTNGRYNTMRLWNLYANANTFRPDVRWDSFLDYDRNNDHNLIFLKDDANIATLRYACLMRNRDENGNGKIDASEVKWYLASIGQLNELFVGEQGLNEEARLYPPLTASDENIDIDGTNEALGWHIQVVSSTSHDNEENAHPTVLWAHEGASTSYYKEYGWTESNKCRHTIRCVRNLGLDDVDEATARTNIMKIDHEPLDLVHITGPGLSDSTTPTKESVYTFDFTRVNPKSKRAWATIELEPSHQFGEQAKVSNGFITGVEVSDTRTYRDIKASLEAGESPCPTGYRMPNVRELAMISTYLPAAWFDGHLYKTSSYYYLGNINPDGSDLRKENKDSWRARESFMTLSSASNHIRCVKDIID